MRALTQDIDRLQEIAKRGDASLNDGFVKEMLDRFRHRNLHPVYGRDAAVGRAINEVAWAFRQLSVPGLSDVVAARRQAHALTALTKLKAFISASGDDITCAGWAACQRRYGQVESGQGAFEKCEMAIKRTDEFAATDISSDS